MVCIDEDIGLAVPQSPQGPGDDGVVIRDLVSRFYSRVRHDVILAPVFSAAIGNSEATWAAHLARLADFWSSVMQGSGRYHGDPFSVHLQLPALTPAMFNRWLTLFRESCREVLCAEQAVAFGARAERIAHSLQVGLFERMPAHKRTNQASGPPAA